MTAPLSPDQGRRALALQALGRTRAQIAEELHCDHKTLGRWLRRYNARAWAVVEKETAAEKYRQVEILRTLASEMVSAWFASKQAAAAVKTTTGGKGDERAERTVKDQCGNPAFATAARACLADIRKLLRIDQTGDPDDATAATSLAAVAAAFDSAVSALPEDVRELARTQVSNSLMELAQRDRTGG